RRSRQHRQLQGIRSAPRSAGVRRARLDTARIEECKEPRTRAVALAGTALTRALNVGVLLTRRKSTRVAQTIPSDQLASMRHPLGAAVAPKFYERSVGHHVVGKLSVRMNRLVDEGRLPVVVGA